jgi:putative Mn2+ efflux pump MntP
VKFTGILMLAVGLAMDATAVAAAQGLAARRVHARHVLLVALMFGGFQALMPLVGFVVGIRLGPLVQAWDHWIAFVLLSALGAKMLLSSMQTHEESAEPPRDPFGLRALTVMAVATSIDALAVGVTLPMLDAPLLTSLATIGITTALLSGVGLLLGRRFGSMLGPRLDVIGGLVLIGLGTKILIEHLTSGA